MSGWAWAVLLKPLGAFLFLVVIVLPIAVVIDRFIRNHMKDSKLRRILLFSWKV